MLVEPRIFKNAGELGSRSGPAELFDALKARLATRKALNLAPRTGYYWGATGGEYNTLILNLWHSHAASLCGAFLFIFHSITNLQLLAFLAGIILLDPIEVIVGTRELPKSLST